MMFLQFFVWGAWYTSIAVYMTNHGMEKLTHWPYTVNPIEAIVAPFFLGLVADRYFATEKVLGVLHLLGGVVMFPCPRRPVRPRRSFCSCWSTTCATCRRSASPIAWRFITSSRRS